MKDVNLKPFVIMALNTELDGWAGEATTIADRVDQHPLNIKLINGVYNGESERSYLVTLENPVVDLAKLLRLAQEYKQESILYVDNERIAWLLYLDGRKSVNLGRFRELMNGESLPNSYSECNGKFYVCDSVYQ